MLTPLYPVTNAPATITVVAPGALAGETSVPVAPLEIALLSGQILDFGSSKFAKLATAAVVTAVALTTEALPTDLDPGDEAEVPGFQAYDLLSDAVVKLSEPKRTALNRRAERSLGLTKPAYTGEDADELAMAVALQMNFAHAEGKQPSFKKSSTNGNPAIMDTFRDRWVDPEAAAIVERVTGAHPVRFTPPFAGV